MRYTKDQAFVAMFDVLGFRALRKTIGAKNLIGIYHDLVVSRIPKLKAQVAVELAKGYGASDRFAEYIYYRFSPSHIFFSDTILLYTREPLNTAYLGLLMLCKAIMTEGFVKRTPLRGALVWGELLEDAKSRILVGEAIESAYRLEQEQVWSGLVIDGSAHLRQASRAADPYDEFFDRVVVHKDVPRVVHYAVPIQRRSKDGRRYDTRTMAVLDWTTDIDASTAIRAFRDPTEKHAKMILRNTIEFEAVMRAQQNW